MFSFYLSGYGGKSFVDFGDMVFDHIKTGAELVWIDMHDHFYWLSNQAMGIKFDEKVFNFGDYDYPIVFDTGTSVSYVPQSLFAGFLKQVTDSLPPWASYEMSEDGTLMRVDCSEKDYYPQIFIQVQGYWLEISAEDYLVQDQEQCMLGFIPNIGNEYWLVGDSFFRGYYVVHDDENSRLGVVPHSTSTKSQVKWTVPAESEMPRPHHLSELQQVGLAGVGVILLFAFLY